jgi:hypothetical protein
LDVQFSPIERDLVNRATCEAEESTSRYYCIPPHRWQSLHYDLLTREDYDWQPLPLWALARLQRCRWEHPARSGGHDFYRIQLNDPGIISAARREKIESNLFSFLVYILTHEMVHLVRLSTILNSADDPPENSEEEDRVHRISRQILSSADHLRLEPIFSKFSLSPYRIS